MKYKKAMADKIKDLMQSTIPYKQYRVDCLTSQRYYLINDNEQIYFNYFDPNKYGIDKLQKKEGIQTMTDLASKLNSIKGNGSNDQSSNGSNDLASKLNANKKGSGSNDLASKLIGSSKDSAINKADMNINKIAEIESLRSDILSMQDTIKDQGVLIADCINAINDLFKLTQENNTILAIIGKDQKSTLKAINANNALIGKNPNIKGSGSNDQSDQVVINRKNHSTFKPSNNQGSKVKAMIIDSNPSNDQYQQIYEIFKGYFNHKFAKSSKADQLDHFKVFIDLIDFYSLQSINDSARQSWQEYRSSNNAMIFAPGSMTLCITSLIQLGSDLDYTKDLAPIIDKKADQAKIAEINNQFADSTLTDQTTDNQAPSKVKDFDYWKDLLSIADKKIIADCVSLLKIQKLNEGNTKEVIRDHLIDNTTGSITDQQLNDFYSYLDQTNFC